MVSQWKGLALAKSVASSPVVMKDRIYGHRAFGWVDMLVGAYYNCSGGFYHASKIGNKISAKSEDGGGNTEKREERRKQSLGNGKWRTREMQYCCQTVIK